MRPQFPHHGLTVQDNILFRANLSQPLVKKTRPTCVKSEKSTFSVASLGKKPEAFAKSFIKDMIVEQSIEIPPFSRDEVGLVSAKDENFIDIKPTERFQKMWGFGAALTESCLFNLDRLDAADRADLMERFFQRETGAGFSFIRIPLGATDFSLNDFTLDDTPNNEPDPELKHFTFKRTALAIETLKEAKRINPDIQFLVSPWTAPPWMKNPMRYAGGRLNPIYYDAYARYLIRSLKEFEQRGVSVDYITIVNEPYITFQVWRYPQMQMDTAEQISFISDYFGPMLAQEQKAGTLRTKILLLDHNWDDAMDVGQMLDDPTIYSVTGGVAFHCYSGSEAQVTQIMGRYPEVPIFVSECSGLINDDHLLDFTYWSSHFAIDGMQVGLTGAVGWNLCLDEQGGPKNNGCPNCRGMVTIDQERNITISPEMHALEQTSRYVRRDAIRIGSTNISSANIQNAAFENPDGSIVLALRNDNLQSREVTIRNDECEQATFTIPASSGVTMKWSAVHSRNVAKDAPPVPTTKW